MKVKRLFASRSLLGQLREDVSLLEERELLVVNLHLESSELWEEDAVPDGQAHGEVCPGVRVLGSGPDGDDGGLLHGLLGLLRDEDAALGLGGGLGAGDENAVKEGKEALQARLKQAEKKAIKKGTKRTWVV